MFGADSVHWPDADRSAVLALAQTPRVSAALADARALDSLLGDWASADVGAAPFDAARLVPPPAQPGVPQRRAWFGVGALAAAAAAAVVLMPIANIPAPAPRRAMTSTDSPVPSATASSETGDAAFAFVFTPTVDEDSLI